MLKIAFKSPSGADANYWKIVGFTFTGTLENVVEYDKDNPMEITKSEYAMKYRTGITLKGYFDSETANNNGVELMTKHLTVTATDKDAYLVKLLKGAGDEYDKKKDIRPFLYACVMELEEWKTATIVEAEKGK